MKKYVYSFCLLIIIAGGLYLYSTRPVAVITDVPQGTHAHTAVSIGGTTFDGLVSDTEILRENGLSGFTGLAPKQLMLFVFDKEDILGFWMKDMLFSLDMVWVDKDLKIVSIEQNVTPESFPKIFFPQKPALYVLEFTAGTVSTLGVKNGDYITIARGK